MPAYHLSHDASEDFSLASARRTLNQCDSSLACPLNGILLTLVKVRLSWLRLKFQSTRRRIFLLTESLVARPLIVLFFPPVKYPICVFLLISIGRWLWIDWSPLLGPRFFIRGVIHLWRMVHWRCHGGRNHDRRRHGRRHGRRMGRNHDRRRHGRCHGRRGGRNYNRRRHGKRHGGHMRHFCFIIAIIAINFINLIIITRLCLPYDI